MLKVSSDSCDIEWHFECDVSCITNGRGVIIVALE